MNEFKKQVDTVKMTTFKTFLTGIDQTSIVL